MYAVRTLKERDHSQPLPGYWGMEIQMKILVIDDNQNNITTAYQTLVGHDLTVCMSHKEADEVLKDVSAGILKFDAVLTDLMLPYDADAVGYLAPNKTGEETAIGFQIAIRALKLGIPYIGILSMGDHHKDEYTALLEYIGPGPFPIIGGKMLVQYYVEPVAISGCDVAKSDPSVVWQFEDGKCYPENGVGKDWGAVLKKLIENT